MSRYFRPHEFKRRRIKRYLHALGVAALLGIAVNIQGTVTAPSSPQYIQVNLASDAPNAGRYVNALLVNPWGMTRSPNGLWWIADHSEGFITVLTRGGTRYPVHDPLHITVPVPPTYAGLPPTPTGIAVNSTADFIVAPAKPAQLIVVTQEGAISGWNPAADLHKAVLTVDNSASAVYTGATIGYVAGGSRLYAANFRAGSIDVFDGYFHQLRTSTAAFADERLPDRFAPFNVERIDGRIYVAYAKQDPDLYQAVRGDALGFVTVYDAAGKLLMRLESGPWMNAPWGMALAPSGFGKYADMVLVANSGNGTIAAFDPVTGRFNGLLEKGEGQLVTIQGLRGIGFGDGDAEFTQSAAKLFFCAGIEEGEHGLFGFVEPGE